MENASKALIIAASVLVAIMIIALGVRIFNGAQSSADTTALDSAEITMFNQKFERFAGTQSGSNVKSLLSFAISNASTNKDDPRKLPQIKWWTSQNSSFTVSSDTTYNGLNNVYDPGEDVKKLSETMNPNQIYINRIGFRRQEVKSTDSFTVSLGYSENGLVNVLDIKNTKYKNE